MNEQTVFDIIGRLPYEKHRYVWVKNHAGYVCKIDKRSQVIKAWYLIFVKEISTSEEPDAQEGKRELIWKLRVD